MFALPLDQIAYLGDDLCRPECVIGEADGTLWTSDARGGVTRVRKNIPNTRLGNVSGLPNGIAIDKDGSFLVADIEGGRLYRIDRSGRSSIQLDQFEGRPLGALNFAYIDGFGRTWLTISTKTMPRLNAITDPVPDGYILLLDGNSVRLVAQGLYFPNEVRIDSEYRHLYLAETTKGRVRRYPLLDNGRLGLPESFGPAPLFDGALVDGICFDASGSLWVTEVSRNGLHVIAHDGTLETVFEDPTGEKLLFPSSIAFVGPDLNQVVVGSTKMKRLATFQWSVSGQPMSHWNKRSRRG